MTVVLKVDIGLLVVVFRGRMVVLFATLSHSSPVQPSLQKHVEKVVQIWNEIKNGNIQTESARFKDRIKKKQNSVNENIKT